MTNKLTELIAERDQLNAEIERLEQYKGVWRPEEGERYYLVDGFMSVSCCFWTNTYVDKARLDTGNVYRTEELAQAHLDYLKALTTIKHYIADNDLGLVADWGEEDQFKHNIYYSHNVKKFCTDPNWQIQNFSPFGYLKSNNACGQLIQACESELMIVLQYE